MWRIKWFAPGENRVRTIPKFQDCYGVTVNVPVMTVG